MACKSLIARVRQQLPEGFSFTENANSVTITNGKKEIDVSIWLSNGKIFQAYYMGGYPVISSPCFQTRHNDGAGRDLAYFAMVKPDGIHWRKDAWLLTTEEKEQVINLAKEIIKDGKFV